MDADQDTGEARIGGKFRPLKSFAAGTTRGIMTIRLATDSEGSDSEGSDSEGRDVSDNDSYALVQRVRRGDEQAAGELFDRYVERLFALARSRFSAKLARRLDPEDVVQSVFRTFFRHTQDGRYEFHQAGDLWRLLAAITVNKVRRQVKRHTAGKRTTDAEKSFGGQESLFGLPPEAVAREPSPDEACALIEELDQVVGRLPELYRRIVDFRLQGRPVEEIAQQVGCSERTVHRASEVLKQRLEKRLANAADS